MVYRYATRIYFVHNVTICTRISHAKRTQMLRQNRGDFHTWLRSYNYRQRSGDASSGKTPTTRAGRFRPKRKRSAMLLSGNCCWRRRTPVCSRRRLRRCATCSTTSLRVTSDFADEVKATAKAEGKTFTQLILELLNAKLEEKANDYDRYIEAARL